MMKMIRATFVAVLLSAAGFASAHDPFAPATYSFWRNFAFEFGVGSYTNQEPSPVSDRAPGFTVGLGHKLGRGAVLLRYNRHTTSHIFSDDDGSWLCEYSLDCRSDEIYYDELALIYRERAFKYISWGLGLGSVRRKYEHKYMVDVPDSTRHQQRADQYDSERGAVFYEFMFHIPVNLRHHLSFGVGVQGQYNEDYPSHGWLVTFQKGI